MIPQPCAGGALRRGQHSGSEGPHIGPNYFGPSERNKMTEVLWRSAAEYGNCSDPGLDDSGGCTRPEAQASGRFCALRISSTREDRRRAVDNIRKVSWGRNPCGRRACPEAARVRDPAKVSGRMDKDGQKKKPDLSIRLLIWPMDTPKGGAHNAREPAWPEHNSTPGNGSQGRAAQKKEPLCQGCAAPVGLGLDNAATMGRRTAADGSPGGPLLQRSSGGPQPAGTAWRLPGAPSGGGGDGRGAGEKLPGQSRRGCVQSPQTQPL